MDRCEACSRVHASEGRACRCGAGQRRLNAVNVDNLQVGVQTFYHREEMTELSGKRFNQAHNKKRDLLPLKNKRKPK